MANRRLFPIFAICVTLALVLCVGGYFAVESQRWTFEKEVSVGLSKLEVLERVGKPDAVVGRGKVLAAWGSKPAKTVSADTWVYFVMPESQHRFVLTFRGDRLSVLEHQQN